MKDIKFQCKDCDKKDCDKYKVNLLRYKPSWASVAGYDACVAWIGEGAVSEDKAVMRMIEPPVAELHYTLQVSHPFKANPRDPCWVLFQPWDSAVNGWEDFPHELEFARLVKCKPVEITRRNDKSYWIVIEVLDSIEFGKISDCFAKGSGPIPPYPNQGMSCIDWSDLMYFSANLESDVTAWFICQKQGKKMTMLLYGTSGWHEDFFFAGNRPLSPEEFNCLDLAFLK